MRSDKKLWDICIEIYNKLYEEANPSANFDELLNSKEAYEEGFFFKYYLANERQEEIINEICRKHRCGKIDKKKIVLTAVLGCSPTVSEERWKKESKRRKKNEDKKRVCK